MGIKMFEFLRRVPGTTPAKFHDDWRDVYGPMLANEPHLRRHIKRYEFNHRLPSALGRERTDAEVSDDGWDGVAVLWFDSLDEMRALSAEPAMARVRERSPEYHHEDRLVVLTDDPEIIVSTPRRDEAGAKLLCILRRNAALDLDTFHDHWLTHHGGLFQNIPELRAPLWGYEQNHGLRDPSAAFDGVTEQWFESLDSFVASLSVPAVADTVNPDVAYMLDPASIHFVMAGKPTVLVA
jgi:hypothetical protein